MNPASKEGPQSTYVPTGTALALPHRLPRPLDTAWSIFFPGAPTFHLSVPLCHPQRYFHGAKIPPADSPGLQVVVNAALAFSIEHGQEGEAGCVIKQAGDGSSSAARGDLTHSDVSGGIAGRNC